jgi:predicted Na+-dependent transporter
MTAILNVTLVVSLTALMLSMGLALEPRDFRVALARPHLVATAMFSILFLLSDFR